MDYSAYLDWINRIKLTPKTGILENQFTVN